MSSKDTAEPITVDREKYWENQGFSKGDMTAGSLTDATSFATTFPRYREAYIRSIWPDVQKLFQEQGLKGQFDAIQGALSVTTTGKTWDPFAIIQARDFLKMLSRSIPFHQAMRIFQDGTTCDIIELANMVAKRETFVNRRARLLGPSGSTLKAIELITNCYVLIQGTTVVAIGSYKDVPKVRKIVEDCMHNIHPIYNIKTLMIRRELEKNEQLAEEDWSRFLPVFKKTSRPKQKKKKIWKKKVDDDNKPIFPPLPALSKVDKLLETGEYFYSEEQKKREDLRRKRHESETNSQAKRLAAQKRQQQLKKQAEKSTVATPDFKEKRGLYELASSVKNKASTTPSGTRKASEAPSAKDFVQTKKQRTE